MNIKTNNQSRNEADFYVFLMKKQKHIKMMSKALENTSKWCYYVEKGGEENE